MVVRECFLLEHLFRVVWQEEVVPKERREAHC